MSERKGKFIWEVARPYLMTLERMRGTYDPALSADCRCGQECGECNFGCILKPWIALGSTEAWGEEYMTPEGFPDGDIADPLGKFIPLEELAACDIHGRPLYLYDEHELDALDAEEDDNVTSTDWLLEEMPEDEEFDCVERYEVPDGEHEEYGKGEPKILEYEELTPFSFLHLLNLPCRMPSALSCGHKLSKKEARGCSKNNTYPNGWRGSDLYKDRRRRHKRDLW